MDLSNGLCLVGGAVAFVLVEDATMLARRWWNNLLPSRVPPARLYDWREDAATLEDLLITAIEEADDRWDAAEQDIARRYGLFPSDERHAQSRLYAARSNNVFAFPNLKDKTPAA